MIGGCRESLKDKGSQGFNTYGITSCTTTERAYKFVHQQDAATGKFAFMTSDEFDVFLETESLSHENTRSEWSDNHDNISKVKTTSCAIFATRIGELFIVRAAAFGRCHVRSRAPITPKLKNRFSSLRPSSRVTGLTKTFGSRLTKTVVKNPTPLYLPDRAGGERDAEVY